MLVKEQEGRVRVLRLANPPANLLTLGLLAALRGEVAQAATDPSVAALVLASAYPKYFSVGLDLQEQESLPPQRRGEPFEGILALYRELRAFPKPTVAALSGSAVLGGWILALACDFRLLTAGTGKIALSEVRMGLSPGPVLIGRMLELAANPSLVKEMVLRGRTLRAEEALAAGLVDALVDAEALAAEALKEAKSLARLPRGGYAAVKAALSRRPPGDEEAIWAQTQAEFRALLAGPEAREGIAAMREKRRPRWESE